MARQTSVKRELEDMTECSICTEVFTDPRVLPCIHTFCLKCLFNHGKDSQPRDTIPCPLCRKEFTIPDDGLEATPKNFFMKKLLNIRQLSAREGTVSITCDICSEDEGNPKDSPASSAPASVRCVQCKQNYCERCSLSHARMKNSADHVQVEIAKDLQQEEFVLKLPPATCEVHRGKEIEVFCQECQHAVCMMCFVTSHRNHKCSDIKDVSDDLRNRLLTDADKVAEGLKKTKEFISGFEKEKTNLIAQFADVQGEINRRADKLIDDIQRDRRKLSSEVDSIRLKRVKQLETVKEKGQHHMVALESFKRYTETLLSSGTDCDVIKSAKSLHDIADELMMFNVIDSEETASCQVRVKFVSSDLLQNDTRNLVGSVSQDTKPSTPTVTHVLPQCNSVSGIASLENDIYVLCNKSQHVEVYDANTFALQWRLAVPGLNPGCCSIAVCAGNRCLYVPDFIDHSLHRVQLTGSNEVVKWSVARNPKGVSVTSVQHVLVVSEDERKLQKFTTRGRLIKDIQLESCIVGPQHAIPLESEQYLVSYDGSFASLSRICLVGGDGTALRRYGGEAGSGQTKVDSPRGLAVDKHGTVLVADRDNGRLLVLDQSLSIAHEMSVSVDGVLQGPYSLHYDRSGRRLYVGEYYRKNSRGYRVIVIDNIDDFTALQVD